MGRFIIVFLVCLMMVGCFNPERNCEDFKTGTYKFESYLEGKLETSTFVRTKKYEIETYQGKTDTAKIRWINNCEYIVQNMDPHSMAEEKPVHIKILTTNKNGYTFEYGVVGENQKARGSVTKVE